MDNKHDAQMRCNAEAASPDGGEDVFAVRRFPGLPPEILASRLAELKQQIALRQSMA